MVLAQLSTGIEFLGECKLSNLRMFYKNSVEYAEWPITFSKLFSEFSAILYKGSVQSARLAVM